MPDELPIEDIHKFHSLVIARKYQKWNFRNDGCPEFALVFVDFAGFNVRYGPESGRSANIEQKGR